MTTSSGTWSQIEIAGKSADLFEPAMEPEVPAALLFLHGHGLKTIKESSVFTAEMERHGLPCICPHGMRSWWTETICPEFDSKITPLSFLTEQIVPEFQHRWQLEPPMIGLFGISMGGQGVLQLAYRCPRQFPVVAAISPAIDFHRLYGQGLPLDEMFPDQEAARQATAILQIHPLNWPKHQLIVCDPTDPKCFEGTDRLCMKLSSTGILYERDLVSSQGGHTWEYFDAMAPAVLNFLAERLEKVSRQL